MPQAVLKQSKTPSSLERFEGKWVAMRDNGIVAFADTLKDLMVKIDAKGLRKSVAVFLVPRKDEGPYILVIV